MSTNLPNARKVFLPDPPSSTTDVAAIASYLRDLKTALELQFSKEFDNADAVRTAVDSVAIDTLLPSQTTHGGEYLTTNGAASNWGAVSLTGQPASNISSGTFDAARLGSGTPGSTNYLRGDSSWQSIPNLTSMVFDFSACTDYSAATNYGFSNASITDTPVASPAYWMIQDTTYRTVIRTKFKKTDSISTLTIWWYGQSSHPGSTHRGVFNCIINGVTATSGDLDTAAWSSATLDVSGCSDGTTYDVQIQGKSNEAGYCGILFSVIAIAS